MIYVFHAGTDNDRVWQAMREDIAAAVNEEGGCQASTKALNGRTADQNARMWAMLTDVSRQVVWYGAKLSKEDWKDVLSASLKAQKAVPGIDGGFVVVGSSTSAMSKRMLSDLVELIGAFGAEHKVVWTEPKTNPYAIGREAAI